MINRDEDKFPLSSEDASEDAAGRHDVDCANEGGQPHHDQESREEVSEETAEEIRNNEKNYSDEGFWKKQQNTQKRPEKRPFPRP